MDERKRFYISCGLLVLVLLVSIGYLRSNRTKSATPSTEGEPLRGGEVILSGDRNQRVSAVAVAESGKRTTSKFSPTPVEEVQNTLDNHEVSITELNGEYAESREAGKLFIVSGKILNRSSQPIEHIKVECSLYDQKRNEIDALALRPGKMIEYEQINNLSFTQLQNALSIWLPEEIERFKIDPGGKIPFMIVFRKPPKDVFDFRVRCTL